MDTDLAEKLNRRMRRLESVESSSETSSTNGVNDEMDYLCSTTNYEYQRPIIFNPYIEYQEFSRKQIQNLMQTFDK
jgi:hypothetical protein